MFREFGLRDERSPPRSVFGTQEVEPRRYANGDAIYLAVDQTVHS